MRRTLLVVLVLPAAWTQAASMTCDLREYKPVPGLTAVNEPAGLAITWSGDGGVPLRMRLAVDGGQPIVRELSLRDRGGQWRTLGTNLVPEFEVTTGIRRVSEQQLAPLRELGVSITPEVIEREKWYAFWDAPLFIPPNAEAALRRNAGPPRRPEEIRHATASYDVTGCAVKTDGARLEATFAGLSMGIFAGSLRYTVYNGTSLVRQEAVARTTEASVAYKYRGGLKGFSTAELPRVVWRDTANEWQESRFGGAVNQQPVPLRAANRLAVAEGRRGSVGVFPAPTRSSSPVRSRRTSATSGIARTARSPSRLACARARVRTSRSIARTSPFTTRRRAPGSAWRFTST